MLTADNIGLHKNTLNFARIVFAKCDSSAVTLP